MEILIHILLGIIGVAAHCLMKYNDLKTKADAGNINFSFDIYLKKDWVTVMLSFLSISLWLLVLPEVSALYPKLLNFVRCSFAGAGFLGSYLIQYIGSRSKKLITNIIDAKTNALDVGPVKTNIDTTIKNI